MGYIIVVMKAQLRRTSWQCPRTAGEAGQVVSCLLTNTVYDITSNCNAVQTCSVTVTAPTNTYCPSFGQDFLHVIYQCELSKPFRISFFIIQCIFQYNSASHFSYRMSQLIRNTHFSALNSIILSQFSLCHTRYGSSRSVGLVKWKSIGTEQELNNFFFIQICTDSPVCTLLSLSNMLHINGSSCKLVKYWLSRAECVPLSSPTAGFLDSSTVRSNIMSSRSNGTINLLYVYSHPTIYLKSVRSCSYLPPILSEHYMLCLQIVSGWKRMCDWFSCWCDRHCQCQYVCQVPHCW